MSLLALRSIIISLLLLLLNCSKFFQRHVLRCLFTLIKRIINKTEMNRLKRGRRKPTTKKKKYKYGLTEVVRCKIRYLFRIFLILTTTCSPVTQTPALTHATIECKLLFCYRLRMPVARKRHERQRSSKIGL